MISEEMEEKIQEINSECNTGIRKRSTCGLILTHQCNLNCRYCYVENKSDQSMSFEMATSLIEDFFERKQKNDCQEIVISFMGGEPFLCFEQIQEITDWMISRKWPIPFLFSTTTNGTLLQKSYKDWLWQHKRYFGVSLSYDGTSQSQNINRTDSASQIDLDFFLSCYEKPEIKMTISEESVSSIAEGIIDLTYRGFTVNANVAHGMPPWSKKTFIEFSCQLDLLVDFYLENPHFTVTPLLKVPLNALSLRKNSIQRRCGTGTDDYIVYDCDGKAYPCHMFSPLVLPKEKLNFVSELQFLDNTTFQNPLCRNCVLQPICPTCYGLNFKRTGDPALKEAYYCRVFRSQVLAACRYYNIVIERSRQADSLSQHELYLEKVISKILPLLKTAERF